MSSSDVMPRVVRGGWCEAGGEGEETLEGNDVMRVLIGAGGLLKASG